MKIVIAGAGAVGFHLAELLSKEDHDITLIDTDETVLAQAGRHLDVLCITGDIATLGLLEEAQVKKAQLFISVTTSEKTNLLAAILAKQLGVKNTIARITNIEHLKDLDQERFKQLGIDVLISPQQLAALEIERLLQRASFTDHYEFENGKISVVGFTLDAACPLNNYTLREIDERNKDFSLRGVALLRGSDTLIPSGDTRLQKGDHLYIATKREYLEAARKFAGKQLKPIKNVMIIGGTPLALRAAQRLENKYSVTVVLKSEDRGKKFLEELDNTLIINADPSDVDALKEEGLEQMDAFVALTPNSEINILASLMAEELGVYKTIAQVENVDYTRISQNIGIDTIINQKLIAANDIFRFVRKGKVEAVASLHGVDGEIIEFEVHKNNRLLRHPVRDLHLPTQCIIAGVVRGQETLVPSGDFHFEINDKVIILALPEAIHKVEEIFK